MRLWIGGRSVSICANDLVVVVDAERRGSGSVRKGELIEVLVFEQEAHDRGAIRCGKESGHVVVVVDRGRGEIRAADGSRGCDGVKGAILAEVGIEREAVVDALPVGVKANGDPAIVQTPGSD